MFVSKLRFICGKQAFEPNLKSFSMSTVRCNDNRPPDDDQTKKAKASEKLKSLLNSILEDSIQSTKPVKDVPKVELPQPRLFHRKKKVAMKEKSKQSKTLGEKIVVAAQKVAENVDGDKKEMESQLLHKLLYKDTHLSEEIVKAAPSLNLGDILSSMKVEKEDAPKRVAEAPEMTRSKQVKQILGRKPQFQRPKGEYKASRGTVDRVNLFSGKPLDIFTSKSISSQGEDSNLHTWKCCYNTELRLGTLHPPSNIYEQMIIWTERGMLWQFPIDNEQGLEEEKKVSFEEHVFLEVHLEGWCPDKGPIRHFMELVCVGLSRNHWLTAKEKKDHIMWYRDFFNSRKTLIKEIGAGEIMEEAVAQQ